jgi:hypothetical protein
MVDPLISKLNQQISDKIKTQTANVPGGNGAPSKFEQVLNDKRIDDQKMNLDNLVNEPKGSEMNTIAANDIQINTANAETGANGSHFDPKKKFFGVFEDLNSDMISLDSSLEVLSNPDIKLNKRQLLAYQAGIGNMTINSELFSRLAQTVAQNVNTLLQTNVG